MSAQWRGPNVTSGSPGSLLATRPRVPRGSRAARYDTFTSWQMTLSSGHVDDGWVDAEVTCRFNWFNQ